MRTSRSPTSVMTANGEVHTREEATVYVKQLDFFFKVLLLEETPAGSFLGRTAKIMGTRITGKSGQNPYLIRNGKRIDCNVSNYVPFVVPGLSPTSPSFSSQEQIHRKSSTRKKWKYE